MNRETLAALKGSIKKWEAIVKKEEMDDGPHNCPLCALFFWKEDMCVGCPVMEKTGVDGCGNTPYDEWSRENFAEVIDKESLKLAKAELAFLKRLLPKRRKKR